MQLCYSFYLNYSGYSLSAQEYLLAILKVDPNYDIKLNFLNKPDGLGVSPNRFQFFTGLQKKKNNPDQINLFHSIPHLYKRPLKSKKHVGFCVFETITLPAEWANYMNSMDCIMTATQFNKNIFEKAGVTRPIHVVPHCFDPEMFNADVKPDGRYAKTTFFSMGTWKKRKNWETLIKAFYDAFEQKDNVCLLIKTDKPQELKSMVASVKQNCEWRSKRTAPIYAEESAHCHFEDIPKIMKKGDIYVCPSLSEGFGICSLNAMALGMPLITIRYGGSLEFAKPELCTYVEPKSYKTYLDMDGLPQFRNSIWPVIRIGDLRDAMIEVWKNYPTEKTRQAYRFVHENFSYEPIGKQFIEALNYA